MSAVMFLVLAFGCQSNPPVPSTQFTGTVVHVHDGDTVHVRKADGTTVKVRFLLCDAPEIDQPRGIESRDFVASLCLNRAVRVVSPGLDEYGRTLGELFVGSMSVNREVIRNGHGWWFYHYSSDPAVGMLEVEARAGKKGLFADEVPLYPRAWRRGARIPGQNGAASATASGGGTPSTMPVADSILILALLPDPTGQDDGHETITLGNSATSDVSIDGWSLVDNSRDRLRLSGMVPAGGSRSLRLNATFQLGNDGDRIELVNPRGETVQVVAYDKAERGKFVVASP